MGANKYENFEIAVIERSDIHEADYNPRKISEDRLKKLKKWFSAEGKGQLAPLVVNKNSMTLVSGHQRLKVLDMLHRGKPYKMTVSFTNLDEKTEIEANVFMNNDSAQGEFDYEKLGQLQEIIPDIDFINGMGFDESEMVLMFPEMDFSVLGESEEAKEINEEAKKFSTEDFRTNRKKELEKIKEQANTSGSVQLEKDDFMITFICVNNEEKQNLMKLMHEKPSEKYVKSNKLYDIYDHKIKLRELT